MLLYLYYFCRDDTFAHTPFTLCPTHEVYLVTRLGCRWFGLRFLIRLGRLILARLSFGMMAEIYLQHCDGIIGKRWRTAFAIVTSTLIWSKSISLVKKTRMELLSHQLHIGLFFPAFSLAELWYFSRKPLSNICYIRRSSESAAFNTCRYPIINLWLGLLFLS